MTEGDETTTISKQTGVTLGVAGMIATIFLGMTVHMSGKFDGIANDVTKLAVTQQRMLAAIESGSSNSSRLQEELVVLSRELMLLRDRVTTIEARGK